MIVNLYRAGIVTGEICITKEEHAHLIQGKSVLIPRPMKLSRKDKPRRFLRCHPMLNRDSKLIGINLEDNKLNLSEFYVSLQNHRCILPVNWPSIRKEQ